MKTEREISKSVRAIRPNAIAVDCSKSSSYGGKIWAIMDGDKCLAITHSQSRRAAWQLALSKLTLEAGE